MSMGEITFFSDSFLWNSSFIGGNKGFISLGEWEGILGVNVHHWLGLRCQKCFMCLGRNSGCLLDMSL